MRQHPRIRKTLKWTSAAMAVVLMVAWVVSIPRDLAVYYVFQRRAILLEPHCLSLYPREMVSRKTFSPSTGLHVERELWWPSWRTAWTFRHSLWTFVTDFGAIKLYHLPLWIPLLVCGATSIVLWGRDRRLSRALRHGLCVKCGYDRAGIVGTAACPECGEAPRT